MPNIGWESQLLGKIEGKLDMLIESVADVREDQKEVASKADRLTAQYEFSVSHEKRIQDLENIRSYMKGWVAAASLLGGLLGWLFTKLTGY